MISSTADIEDPPSSKKLSSLEGSLFRSRTFLTAEHKMFSMPISEESSFKCLNEISIVFRLCLSIFPCLFKGILSSVTKTDGIMQGGRNFDSSPLIAFVDMSVPATMNATRKFSFSFVFKITVACLMASIFKMDCSISWSSIRCPFNFTISSARPQITISPLSVL